MMMGTAHTHLNIEGKNKKEMKQIGNAFGFSCVKYTAMIAQHDSRDAGRSFTLVSARKSSIHVA